MDRASSWYLNKGRPTWWHLLYYVNLLLNMFRMLIHPSSGACDYLVSYCVGYIVLIWGVLVLCSGIGCWWCGIRVQAEPGLNSAQYSLQNNKPSSRKILKMDVLTSETCWAVIDIIKQVSSSWFTFIQILVAVRPSSTWWRAVPWWQGTPTYDVETCHVILNKWSIVSYVKTN